MHGNYGEPIINHSTAQPHNNRKKILDTANGYTSNQYYVTPLVRMIRNFPAEWTQNFAREQNFQFLQNTKFKIERRVLSFFSVLLFSAFQFKMESETKLVTTINPKIIKRFYFVYSSIGSFFTIKFLAPSSVTSLLREDGRETNINCCWKKWDWHNEQLLE